MDKRMRRLVSFFLYAVAVIRDNGERSWKGLRSRGGGIFAWICSLCLVVNLLPMTAFAAGTDTSSDISSVYEYVQNEEGSNIEEKTPTEQPTEEVTEKPAEAPTETPTEKPTETPTEKPTEESTETPSEDLIEKPTQDSSEKPTEDATENPTEKPTEDSTEQPTEPSTEGPVEKPTEDSIEKPVETPTGEEVEKPTETPLEKEENFTGTCTCDTLCEEGIINLDCEVCSAEGADLSAVCEGREHEETSCICDPVVTGNGVHTNPDCPLYVEPELTAYKQVVALFKALPSADSITEDTTEEERDILRAQIDEAIDALYALSDEDFAKFTAEHETLIAAAVALREAIGEAVPNLLTDSVVEILREEVSQGSYSTLAAAITAASNGDTLKILKNIDLGTTQSAVIVKKSLTLDLNDNTITHKGTYGAIKLTGNADLTVTDSGTNGDGKLEETSDDYLASAIYSESAGTITVNGGTVTATNAPAAGGAIYNMKSGSIVVDGGTVMATSGKGTAIYNASDGSVVVKGGQVSASGDVYRSNSAIYSPGGGSIEVSGGMVSGDGVPAINSSIKPTTITIKDGAKVISACTAVNLGTIMVYRVGSVLNIEGGTVENTADSGNAIRNAQATVNISGGTVSASGSGIAVNNATNGSAVNISGGAISTTDGCAIYNEFAEKIVISGNAMVTSANSKTDNTDGAGVGTIFMKRVTEAKVLLDIQGSAIVKNTADPAQYAVYFDDTRVTSKNLSTYYTAAETATVGKVHPEPSVVTKPVPTVSSYRIYANGVEIKIVAGNTPDYTNVLYDKDGDGQIGDTEYLKIGSTEPTAAGYDLNLYDVYGGSYNTAITANPKITMTGGKVTRIHGGGCISVVTGDTSVTVSGGEVSFLYGGGSGLNSNVTGNTAVAISGGRVTSVYGGAAAESNVSRDTSVTMSGGKVTEVYGGGSGSKVEGSTSVDVSGGEAMSVCGGGYMGTVTGTATVILRGGTVSYQVYGGSDISEDVVEGGSTVTIGGGVNIGNPNNSDSGIVINGGTDSFTNGVTSFVIKDDLTGTAGSIFVSLPAGYTGGIIATEAVSGDLAKIKLAGDGAVGKEAYLDGTEIKVRQSGVDKTALSEAIAAANSAKNGITASNNPASSVADGTKFVTTAEMKALTDAIAAAKIVMDNSLATAGEVAAAADALNSAVTTFKAAIKTGTDTGSGGGTSDGGSSGGGSSGGGSSNDSGTKTSPATTEPGTLTESEIKMEGTVDASGNVTVTLPEQHVEDAIKKAEEEARKSGNPVKGITLVLNVNTGSNTAGSVTVNLPKVTQETIISKEIANTMIVVNHPEIQIGLDLSAVQEINRQANTDVNITSTRQDNSRLTGNAKAVIGSRPVFDLKVNYGSGKEVTHFGAGSVSVAIPYTLGAGEVAGGVYAVYVDGSGNVQWMDSSVYDAENRLLRFNTSHFSIYGIGYKAPAAFTDTQGHWAKDDIQFVVDRGLMNGASATAFDPDGAVTRGMFVATLGRLAGADVSGYATSSFTDVGADAYYMGYVEWAVEKGIVGGTSATTFAPDDAVTREQMAVMMANYARAAGISLPKVHTENSFADGADISAGAREAVKAMQMAGVLAGRDGNRFDPQGTATRAQAAAALHRFMEVTMDVSTAQGWRQNDDGQWMYYENGSPVKNTTRQVGGEEYSFNAFGVTLDYPKKKTRTGTYTVQAGDSFWLIAKKHNVDMYMLAAVNGKTIHSVIHPGDVLMIPQ